MKQSKQATIASFFSKAGAKPSSTNDNKPKVCLKFTSCRSVTNLFEIKNK